MTRPRRRPVITPNRRRVLAELRRPQPEKEKTE